MNTMYLFRAINSYDENNYKNSKSLIAAQQEGTLSTALDSSGSHIASGSKKEDEEEKKARCWISTSKSFEICTREFSIPQTGNFNTAKDEKEIVVIDAMYWRSNQPSYQNNGCYTVFTDTTGKTVVDLGDASVYPSTKVNKTKSQNSYINCGAPYKGKTINEKGQMTQLNDFRQKIESNVQTGILDMSLPTESDRAYAKTGPKRVPIQEFSLMDYVKHGLISGDFPGRPIASGQAKMMQEVLILNQIPSEAIKIKLSILEKNILYALSNDNRMKMLDDMIQGTLKFSTNESNAEKPCLTITNSGISSSLTYSKDDWALLTKFLVDLAVGNCKNNPTELSLQEEFDRLKICKRQLLQDIATTINENYKTENQLDNEVSVYCFTANQTENNKSSLSSAEYYNVLAIQDDTNIYDYKCRDFEQIKEQYFEKKVKTIQDENIHQ